jgi:hypothetical protein
MRGGLLATFGATTLVAVAIAACASSAPEPPPGLDVGEQQPSRPSKPPQSDAGAQIQQADASVPDAAECATVAPNHRCGLDPQCGCEATETCDVTNQTTGAASCVAAGTSTLGRPCTQTGDCLAGLTCLYGACRPYCKTPRSKCGTAGTELCVEHVGGDGKPVTNVAVCTISCDPRNPSAVCGTNTCLWFPTYYAPEKISDCNFAGTKVLNQTCVDDYDCAAGLACVVDPKKNNAKVCERWCRIGVAGDCASPLTCKDVFGSNAPVINGQKEGICQ